jgi:hypothetical protein
MPNHAKTLAAFSPPLRPARWTCAWKALPREEQLRLLRAALTHPDCATVSPATMSEILTEARKRADTRRRG